MATVVALTTLGTAQQAPADRVRVQASPSVPTDTNARVHQLALESLRRHEPEFEPLRSRRPFRIILHATGGDVPREMIDGLAPGTPAFALRGRDEIHIVLDRLGPSAPLATVITHEIAHVLLDQHVGPRQSMFVPRWVHEGIAQVTANHGWLGSTEDQLFIPARTGSLPRFSKLREFPRQAQRSALAYAQSRSFVTWLDDQLGRRKLLRVLRVMRNREDFPRALFREHSIVLLEVEDAWRNYIAYRSGAGLRFVSDNCFSYVGIIAFVLLAAAAGRRYAAERRIRERLEHEDIREELDAQAPNPGLLDPRERDDL